MSIPVRNVYHLLSYAWKRVQEAELIAVDAERCPDVLNLLATSLDRGLSFLRRRGFDRGYVSHVESIRGLRGRVHLWDSTRNGGTRHGVLTCEFDEFSHDVLHNRILKATLKRLMAGPVASDLKHKLHQHHLLLADVREISISTADFKQVLLHRNNSFYGYLLDICRFVHINLIPLPNGTGYRFKDFSKDPIVMGHLFESFIRNFVRQKMKLQAESPHLSWHMTGVDEESRQLLPKMKTDVVLYGPRCRTIIECKFAVIGTGGQYQERIDSGHLYQLNAYLTNLPDSDEYVGCGGLLLYPSSGVDYALEYRTNARTVRVKTLNLAQPWEAVEDDLVAIVNSL